MNLPDLLKATLDLGGSDLHLSIGSPPQVRVDGHLRRLAMPELTPDVLKGLAYSVLTPLPACHKGHNGHGGGNRPLCPWFLVSFVVTDFRT